MSEISEFKISFGQDNAVQGQEMCGLFRWEKGLFY